MKTPALHPCPACGFEVFCQTAGSYDICPVCNWEDDEVQLRFPAMQGGANTASLFEWQQKVLQRFPPDVICYEDYHRCSKWRPLTQKDLSGLKNMAPENILNAALKILFVASYTTRNWALDESVPRKQIYDLSDAIHEIPDLLTRWRPDAESELLMYLDCYDEKWPTPKLRIVYEDEKKMWGGTNSL